MGFFEFFGSELIPQDAEYTKLVAAAGQQVVQRLLCERAERQAPPVEARSEPSAEFAVIDLDARGCILRWGKDAERLKGFRPNEVIGKHVSMFYLESEEARAAENLESAASRGFAKGGGWRVRRGQERFWADVFIVSRRAPHGEIVGYTKVVHGPLISGPHPRLYQA
jgi:PAS domain S-box-containing protein